MSKKQHIVLSLWTAAFFLLNTDAQLWAKDNMQKNDINVVELTAEQAHQDLISKKYTSKDLTQAFLDRIATYNPSYNAQLYTA